MRTLLTLTLLTLLTAPAGAITLGEATTEAHNWIVTRQAAIQNRVLACVTEGNPRLCHTAWAASVTANTVVADSQLATQTFDDLGRVSIDACANECPTGQGTYAAAGINIPASAPLNVKIDVHKAPGGWGALVVVKIMYEGTEYIRGYALGQAASFGWQEVVTLP